MDELLKRSGLLQIFPAGQIGRLFAVGWLVAWVAVLIISLSQCHVQGIEALVFILMMILSFPLGYAALYFVAVALVSSYAQPAQMPASELLASGIWLFVGIAGYFQWFVLLPWILKRLDRQT
jgi:hypothetical protein